jgi:hypothetical protein
MQVITLLEILGVHHVMHVDDSYDVSTEEFLRENFSEFCARLDIDDSDEFAEQIVREKLKTPENKGMFWQVYEDIAGAPGDAAAIGFLGEHIPSHKITRKGTCGDLAALLTSIQEVLDGHPSETVLVILDQKLGSVGVGSSLVPEIVGHRHPPAAVLILTHSVGEESEQALEAELSTADCYVTVQSKTSTSLTPAGLVRVLRRALLGTYFGRLRSELLDVTAQAHTTAQGELERLSFDELDSIIAYSARAEGAWIVDFLARVFIGTQRLELQRKMRKSDRIHSIATRIWPLSQNGDFGDRSAWRGSAFRLQRRELYLDKEINMMSLEIGCGDIFKTDSGTTWVCLEQPCDLFVRDSGFRNKKNDKDIMIHLVLVERVDYDQTFIYGYELKHFSEKREKWIVRLNVSVIVPAWVLDLSVYTNNGRSEIGGQTKAPPKIVPSWAARYNLLKKYAVEVHSAGEYASHVARLPTTRSDFKVQLKGDGERWNVRFSVFRTGRLLPPRSIELLQAKAAYLSRWAHDADLVPDWPEASETRVSSSEECKDPKMPTLTPE